jgi:ABC-type bacteriocin/lantibiotic exporter with double-glycine peptidase domain
LLHKPNFIIFDEATSALDSETEKKLMYEIKNYIKNRSLLIISHRKSTLEHCNKVYVLRNQDLHLENNSKINGE